MMSNVYFDLTREFNRQGRIAILSSGQAVVHYRLAIMSKDGDWILAETAAACRTVLAVLGARSARYRPGAPLDPRWLRHGWSSHLEFTDEKDRRIRCDFVTRAPRVSLDAVSTILDARPAEGDLPVLDLLSLIEAKKTKRAKDYAVIGELARLLPPEQELLHSTDPDRILELAADHGMDVDRAPVSVAVSGGSRTDVVVALAKESDGLQQRDAERLRVFEAASANYIRRFREARLGDLRLPEAHDAVLRLASDSLPEDPDPTPGVGVE